MWPMHDPKQANLMERAYIEQVINFFGEPSNCFGMALDTLFSPEGEHKADLKSWRFAVFNGAGSEVSVSSMG